jgi:hypothetical protein
LNAARPELHINPAASVLGELLAYMALGKEGSMRAGHIREGKAMGAGESRSCKATAVRYLAGAILVTVSVMTVSCEPPDDTIPEAEISSARRFLYAPPECADAEVLAAMNAAATKYNLPRWFIYAVVRRESSFNRNQVNPNDGGQGLTQLTGNDHQGYPYPENLAAPNNSYNQWVWDMGLNQLGPWVNMNDVTPLADYDDAFNPAHNLDRYATVYATPAYFLFQSGSDPAENLRRVAYHWFRGLFDNNYGSDSTYFEGQWGYDAYVAQYKPAVEAEDGVWQGPPCKPPYSAGGCGAAPTPSCGDGVVSGTEQCDEGAANGAPGSCCTSSCTLKASGVVCRAAADECDVAETCSGSLAACPMNAFQPSGTTCAGGTCDSGGTCQAPSQPRPDAGGPPVPAEDGGPRDGCVPEANGNPVDGGGDASAGSGADDSLLSGGCAAARARGSAGTLVLVLLPWAARSRRRRGC